MRTQEYWDWVALLREMAAQGNADAIIRRMIGLYDEAAAAITEEIEKVLLAFGKLSGLDRKEAEVYISKAEQDSDAWEVRL